MDQRGDIFPETGGGSQPKAELVEQARALESQRAQLICPPLPDGLVDDPLI